MWQEFTCYKNAVSRVSIVWVTIESTSSYKEQTYCPLRFFITVLLSRGQQQLQKEMHNAKQSKHGMELMFRSFDLNVHKLQLKLFTLNSVTFYARVFAL